MKKNNIILCVGLLLSLSGCADPENSSSQTETTTAVTVTTSSQTVAPKTPVYKSFRAEITAYENGILRFEYEGRECELPFDKRLFKNEERLTCINEPNVSEMIINNRFGEKVFANIITNDDQSRILSCDVIKPNGKVCDSSMLHFDDNTEKDLFYTFIRKGGSACEIKNEISSFEFDLNDLINYQKLDYPNQIYPVAFKYYEFGSGKRLLLRLDHAIKITENGGLVTDNDSDIMAETKTRTCFYGVVQSYNEQTGKAVVLLNDKKTLCTVPTYYNDGGEIKEGAEVMITLSADSSLFGSGGEHEFDYSVMITNRDYYMSREDMHSFDELAYARYDGSIYEVKSVTVRQAERERQE